MSYSEENSDEKKNCNITWKKGLKIYEISEIKEYNSIKKRVNLPKVKAKLRHEFTKKSRNLSLKNIQIKVENQLVNLIVKNKNNYRDALHLENIKQFGKIYFFLTRP